MNSARVYSIGIDLGTTNTTVSYVRCEGVEDATIFPLPQMVERGIVQGLESFPSEVYILTDEERRSAIAEFSIHPSAVEPVLALGTIARNMRTRFSERVIISAKSWLAERSIDPRAAILPWGADDVALADRLSPVRVSSELLKEIRLGWDETIGREKGALFGDQRVTVTVPASFDEAALALTREAIAAAGYPSETRLLEEPQAALLSWLGCNPGKRLTDFSFKPPHDSPYLLLVCDVGGGTTDLSLFELRTLKEGLTVKRVYVSDHILLGGDNIDLALALELERLVNESGFKLAQAQWRFVITEARRIKELALQSESSAEDTLRISIPGEGSALVGGTITVTIKRSAVVRLVLDGFFPKCALSDRPTASNSALRQLGLNFAYDPAVTHHLAEFISKTDRSVVNGVLFNGGTLRPSMIRDRLLGLLVDWQYGAHVDELPHADMEFAVSRGAALFGSQSRKTIEAGAARAIFLEVGSAKEGSPNHRQLVCVLPRGAEEGQRFEICEPTLAARLDVPVRFLAFASRDSDAQVGDVVAFNERSFIALPPLQTLLRSSTKHSSRRKLKEQIAKVRIVTELDFLGRLRLALMLDEEELASSPEIAELSFDVRQVEAVGETSSVEPAGEGTVVRNKSAEMASGEFPGVNAASDLLVRYFGAKNTTADSPKRLFDQLERQLSLARQDWPAVLCRQLWPKLYPGITRRGRSVEHEITWLSLAGYLLRPGFGVVLDELRVEELFELHRLGLSFPREARSQIQYWILWRRVSGGLSALEQQQIYQLGRSRLQKAGAELPEIYRALASLERLTAVQKRELLDELIQRLRKERAGEIDFISWSLMRLLSREPFAGVKHLILPPSEIEDAVEMLLSIKLSATEFQRLRSALMAAAQFTGDRAVDVSEALREKVIGRLSQSGIAAEQLSNLRLPMLVGTIEQAKLFGEALPLGLMHHP